MDDVTHVAWVFADQINVFEADLMSSPAVGAPPATYIGHVQFDNVTSVRYMGDRMLNVTHIEGPIPAVSQLCFTYKLHSLVKPHNEYEFRLDVTDKGGHTIAIVLRQLGVTTLDKDQYDTPQKGATPAKGSPGPSVVRDLTGALVLAKTFIHGTNETPPSSANTPDTPLLIGVGLMVVAVGFYGMKGKRR